MEYLLAGSEEAGTGHLLVTMQSVVVPWTPRMGLLLSEGLRNGCLRTQRKEVQERRQHHWTT